LEPTFFANGAGAGGVRERALGSPTHPLAHRGAWRRKTGRGGSAPPLGYGLHVGAMEGAWRGCTGISTRAHPRSQVVVVAAGGPSPS
jgi:hypothetical protein